MKIKRITSLLLAVLFILGSINLGAVQVFAKVDPSEVVPADFDHLTRVFNSPEDRIAAMQLFAVVDGYELYADSYSGEVGIKNLATGQILLTNPYSVGSSKAAELVKFELLSQLIVHFDDGSNTEKHYSSYEDASQRGQVSVERIKGGIRVEYSIGKAETRYLVPKIIEKTRFETEILLKLPAAQIADITAFYSLKDPSTAKSETLKKAMHKAFPITEKMPVYVLPESGSNATTESDLKRIEAIIKQYCPDYTFEDLDYDHELTEYQGVDREPPNFRMALEYTINGGDLVVSLPANGISYNEQEYTINSIDILPYMGAGENPNTGFTFIPDGSGSIFKFEDLDIDTPTTVTVPLYGTDYAYQTITSQSPYQQTARVPVYGIVETADVYKTVTTEVEVETDEGTATETVSEKVYDRTETKGFLAIIEEGDTMGRLSTYHGGAIHDYNTVKFNVTPRPKDAYDLGGAISVGNQKTWTIISEKRYTGNFKIRYIMLPDQNAVAENGAEGTYEPSYNGMVDAYRDYLIESGVLVKLQDSDLKDGMPLYIETFGATEATKKILSIPVTVMTSLTSFDDIRTIYSELSEKGVKNINFKLTGYANGGMYSTVPYRLKWEKAVGGSSGFENLISDAKEKNYGVYPDFDFAYINDTGAFDGLSLKNHAVKTLDNRYTNKRVYSVTTQNYMTYYQLALSPAYYYRFIDKLYDAYSKYEPVGISVSTLGDVLNSDFDEKEPYTREENKNFTMDAFADLENKYNSVMTAGGNAYSWKNVDHITSVPLDSSRYLSASYSVPFIGQVLHGYVNFAGDPINMAGDIRYEILKCIENGASMYFILSYDNTELLKKDERLSEYYSIRYDIWYEDIVELYFELNEILEPLQTKDIVDHQFLIGERIPDEDEAPDTEGTGKYRTMDDGRIVKVTYEDGTSFILNYNYFAIVVDGITVDAYGYVKLS